MTTWVPVDRRLSALATAGATLAIAIVGFWYPLCMDWRYADADSRMGFFYLFSLPIILMYAVVATWRIHHAFWSAPDLRPWVRRSLAIIILMLCWSPFELAVIRLCTIFIDGEARLGIS